MALTPGRKLIKVLASLKLAVVIIITLMTIIAWGTIVESQFDAEAAKKMVYDTPIMYGTMLALAVSLIAVMVDRWPWKPRHIPFILAHIGILILLFGSVLTMRLGIDGSMMIEIGKDSRTVTIPSETDVLVYASFGGLGMTKLLDESVDFFRRPPTVDRPFEIPADKAKIKITDYRKYVLPSRKVEASDESTAGAALRFQIVNERVSVVEWLVQRGPDRLATHDFGPARIHLGPPIAEGRGANEIFLTPEKDGKIRWVLFRKDSKAPAIQGVTDEGGLVKTGWMGLELRVLRYLPKARERWDIEERGAPTPLTTSAVKVWFQDVAGKTQEQWLLLNDTVRLFTDDTAYMVSYLNHRIELNFPIQLKDFQLVPYEGTQKAKEYKSLVEMPGQGEVLISMNEPARHDGLTFYQSSFQTDERTGAPTASVFSVNHDPGRWWKYLGSLIISVGMISMFWSRRKKRGAGGAA